MNVETEILVERGNDEIAVQISGTVEPYVPAKTYRPPEFCSPEEGGEVEFTATVNSEEFELTTEELALAEAALQQAYAEEREAIEEGRYESETLAG